VCNNAKLKFNVEHQSQIQHLLNILTLALVEV